MGAGQMNVRIGSELKQTGDVVLARQGVSPSQVVRSLWEYLVIHDDIPDSLKLLLRQHDFEERLAQDGSPELPPGSAIVSDFYARFGIPEPAVGTVDYEALRDEAADEQFEEWGLA